MSQGYLTTEHIRYELANLKQLSFEVTDACNLQCKYCAYGELYDNYDKRKNKKLSFATAVKIIDYLVALWNSEQNVSSNRNVYITFYGGEPLLNMTFIKRVVDYVNNLECPHRSFTFSITTNAILLDRYMDFLAKNDFNLLISLDGNEHNTSYRVNKSNQPVFNQICKNVDMLKEKYPEYFENKVFFNAVLHNRSSIAEIYNFFKEKYNKIPNIGEVNNVGIREDKKELFNATYRNSLESLHQAENYESIEQDMFIKSENYRSVTTFLHQHSGFVYRDYIDLLFGRPKKIIPTGTCVPFERRMFITVNGKILPCERIGQQFSLGKVNEKSVELDIEMIADMYNAYYAKIDKLCSKCYTADSCIQCIFNLPDFESDCPVCYGY